MTNSFADRIADAHADHDITDDGIVRLEAMLMTMIVPATVRKYVFALIARFRRVDAERREEQARNAGTHRRLRALYVLMTGESPNDFEGIIDQLERETKKP